MSTQPRCYPELNDDPAFLALVDRIVTGLITGGRPEEVYLIRIDNWFDHKWLTFSGIGRVNFQHPSPRHPGVALDEFRADRVTFPPFNPNRVRSQIYFCRTTKNYYEEQAPARLVHRPERQHSARNLNHRVADFSDSAVFIWYSSETANNRRGSVMAYSVHVNDVSTWFASFSRDGEWRLDRVKGANRNEVEALLETQ